MATTQILLTTLAIFDDPDFSPSGDWGFQVVPVALGISPAGQFQGYSLNWGVFDNQNAVTDGSSFQLGYTGYTTNWATVEEPGTLNGAVNNPYVGYTTNFGGSSEDDTIDVSLVNTDIDSVIDHPKDQKLYYKLKGWNPNTQTYETWVISENITGRPELFDPTPGRQPPNYENDVFKTPPSGNQLQDIVIAARWIQ